MIINKEQGMRQMKYVLSVLAFISSSVFAEKSNEWFLHSSISPNGKTVAFSYKGDIYTVPAAGGTARALTLHHDWDGHPIWSEDGKSIAFSSDRSGNLDVYLMPAEGGKAKRLTYHSSHDIPQDFSNDDEQVLFTSARMDSVESTIFPTGRLTETYSVSVKGGTPTMLSTIPASELQVSPNGKQILYRDEKSYENQFRKHDTSAFARDVWLFDKKSGKHTQLTRFAGGDHNPVWQDKDTYYYTSEEKTGVFNVWRSDLNGSNKKQITNFKQHPIRSLSISNKGTLAFTHHGNIYLQKGDKNKPKHLNINIANDSQEDELLPTSLVGKVSEFSVSPDGKEVAFVSRGEVFVASTEFGTTKLITNTPEQERSVSFHKDGRTLLYAAERNGTWGLVEASIADENEPYFFAATTINEEMIHQVKTDSFQPVYSPDGEKIAFLSNRDEIQVFNRETKKVNVALSKNHNYSYADGDIDFAWAPDSHWMTASYAPRKRLFVTNIGVFPSDGSAEPVDVSASGYNDGTPSFHKDGKAVLWYSSRYGKRDHGSWGREYDVMAAFLTQDSYDKFRYSKEEYALYKELEEKQDKEKPKKEGDSKEGEDAKSNESKVEPLEIEWDNLDQRTARLTLHASNLGDAILTKDTKDLYYLARFEKGYDLWRHNIRERKTQLVAKLNARSASMNISQDGKNIYILADGQIKKGKVGKSISLKPVRVSPVMELQQVKEREFMFDHSWRVIKDKFYRDDFHGIDWDQVGEEYRKKLPSIGHGRDFANMFAEMTGELNASHIGSSYRAKRKGTNDSTGALGLFFDLSNTKSGLKVKEVLAKGPFDKASSKVEAGVTLVAVDGKTLSKTQNLYKLLNRKTAKPVRFTFKSEEGNEFDEVVKPLSLGAMNGLMYRRWVASREALVEKLSGGRLAYVHVRSMNDPSFRDVYSNLLGKHFDKEAVVVDTRFNGGGWLHNDLAKLLTGNEYFTMHVRGRQYHGDPLDQWNKPSVLVINEGNYSDAHAFSYTYQQLEIGEIIGMPVPGTMTAVWWETGISGDFRAGVPQVGMKNTKGEYLENNQTEPDHLVKNDPESTEKGQDKQIEKAVSVLLKQLDSM